MKRYSLFTILVFLFLFFSIDDQSCSAATVNGLSGKTKTKASAASTAASVPRKLDQPQDLTVPDIVTWLPVLLTASSTSTQGKLLKSVDNCSVVKSTRCKKLAPNALRFTYQNLKF